MQQDRTSARHRAKGGVGKKVAVVAMLLVCVLVGTAIGIVVHYPHQASQALHQLLGSGESGTDEAAADAPAGSTAGEATPDGASSSGTTSSGAADAGSSSAADADAQDAKAPEAADGQAAEHTKQIAAYGKLKIFSPIAQKDITGVLFHQASYTTALVMTTKLPDANPEKVSVDNPVRVNNKQKKGDWVDADALHLWRETDVTEMDTSIDVGAKAGTTVYAPVTGTVVLVKKYDLYGEVPDIRIHIQPEGHPELDLVLLHQYDPLVKAGDKVEGGATPISHVRDIAKDLTDVQLGFFTEPDDPGNHSHVQLNNADEPGYREDSLKGAYKVKD